MDFFGTVQNLAKFADRAGDFGGLIRLIDFLKKKPDPATPPSAPAVPASPPSAATSVNTLGSRDEKGLAMLETMFSIEPAPGPHGARPLTVSTRQREAFGQFAKLLTNGESGALENIFALAEGEKVWVRLTWIIPHGVVGVVPGPKRKAYEFWARPRGVRIYRAIADDVLLGATPVEQERRAGALLAQMRRLNILDNLSDDAITATRKAKLLVSQADTLGHETRAKMKLGFNDRLWAELMADTEIKTKNGEIKAAEPLDAIRLHEEYQQLLLEKTTAIVERELAKRRWRIIRRRVTVRGLNIHVPLPRPGRPSRALAISLISIGIIIWFFVTLGSNA